MGEVIHVQFADLAAKKDEQRLIAAMRERLIVINPQRAASAESLAKGMLDAVASLAPFLTRQGPMISVSAAGLPESEVRAIIAQVDEQLTANCRAAMEELHSAAIRAIDDMLCRSIIELSRRPA